MRQWRRVGGHGVDAFGCLHDNLQSKMSCAVLLRAVRARMEKEDLIEALATELLERNGLYRSLWLDFVASETIALGDAVRSGT